MPGTAEGNAAAAEYAYDLPPRLVVVLDPGHHVSVRQQGLYRMPQPEQWLSEHPLWSLLIGAAVLAAIYGLLLVATHA